MLAGGQTAPDNTGTNSRDRESGAITADRQKMDQADQETARRIRRLLVTDKSLSLYAHNAKIVVRDGMVTLRGPVRSEEEKDSVARKAISIAGADKVVNQLEVAPPK
jgi:osmotically-inducible protein OsmY